MISIVFSFYNEEESIPLLIQSVRSVMAKESLDYELVFVNDDSTDNSITTILNQGKVEREKIVVVNMSRRFGGEESFLAGLEVAQGDAVVMMYTDMQDPPETIPEMLAQWRQGADIVHTIRRKRVNEHPAKIIAAHLAYKWITQISDIRIPRDAGDFKLLSRKVVDHLRQFTEAEPYLRGLIPWIGFKQAYVTYDLLPRKAGTSKVALFGKKALRTLLDGLVSFSAFPIYLIFYLAVVGFGGTLIALSIFALGTHFHSQLWAMIVLLLFLWATAMTAIGIVGIYVLKIYKNTTGRPRYIIKNILRND